MKRIKQIFILLMMVLGISLQAQTIQMRIPDLTATNGDVIDIPVYVDNSLSGLNVFSYQLQISYNANLLLYNSVIVAGTMSSSWGLPTVNPAGNLQIANAGGSALSGTGTLLYIRFNCISNGGTAINFNGGSTNNYFNEGSPEMTFDNGYISIAALPVITIGPNTALLSVGEQLQCYVSGGTAPYSWDLTNPAVASINSAGLLTATSHGFTKATVQDDNGIYDETNGDIEIRAMKLSMPSVSEWQGSTIEIPINTTSLSGLNVLSGDISFTFNGNILSPTGINTTGTLLSGYSNIVMNNSIPGTVNIGFAGTTPLTGSGILLYVQFDISATNTGNTSLTFSNALFNESLLAKTENGYFTMIHYNNIYISPSTWSLVAGQTKQFTASGGLPPFTWSTTDPTVASIDGAGILTALKNGIIQVVATDAVGSIGTSGNVTVYDTYVSLPHVYASLGSQYDMPVLISTIPGGQDVFAIQGTISFESPELLALDIITTGTMTNGWTFATNVSGNTITFAGAGTSSFNTAGAMFKVRFQLTPELINGENAWVNINDIMLNEGVPFPTLVNGSITGAGGIILDLKAFLEGPFNLTEMNTDLNPFYIPNNQPYNISSLDYDGSESFGAVPNADVVDWVLVELRETSGSAATATAATMVARQAALFLKNGEIVGTDGISNLIFGFIPTDNLYAVVWHRNHLGIMSSIPLAIGGGIYSYDFTTALGKAYLNGQTSLGSGKYGMYAGNSDGNATINTTDITSRWKLQAGESGYFSADMDMNSQVNNFDKNDVWLPNEGKGSQVP